MCQFTFAHAHTHHINDHSEKLLIIALENNLYNVPEVIDNYIKGRKYITRKENLFWQKLLYFMPDRKKQNYHFDGNNNAQEDHV